MDAVWSPDDVDEALLSGTVTPPGLPSPPRRTTPLGTGPSEKPYAGRDTMVSGADRENPRRIKRDASRGVDPDSRKEIRDAEDAVCNAGMRNPAAVCERWPALVTAMQPVRQALMEAMDKCADLRDLPLAVGRSVD